MKNVTKNLLISILIGVGTINILLYVLRPYMPFKFSVSWFVQVVSIVFLGVMFQLCYLLMTKAYKDLEIKYLLKINILNKEYDVLSNFEGYTKIMDWYNSDKEVYTLEQPNGVFRFSKSNIIEISYSKVSIIRQLFEPLIYVAKKPSIFTVKDYLKGIGLLIIGILGYMYYKDIPFSQFLVASSSSSQWFNIGMSILALSIAIPYVYQTIYSFFKALGKRDDNTWTTYPETIRFSIDNSLAFNAAASMFLYYLIFAVIGWLMSM